MGDEEEMIIGPPDPDTTCNICYAEFLDPEDLTVHLTQVHVEEDLMSTCVSPCQFCSSVFSNTEDYVKHVRDTHLVSIRCCKFCTRAFTDYDQLQRHESKHPIYNKKKLIYSCSQCNKVFDEICDLENHEQKNHSDIKEGVFLNHCYSILSSVLNIKAVKFLHSLGTDTSYFCIKCAYNSNDVISYIKHLQTENCTSFVCNKCCNVYKDKPSLWRHMQDHKECWVDAADEDVKKKCPECHKMIKAVNLKCHRKECKVIKCSICKEVLSSMYDLSEHQTKEHPMAIMMKFCMLCNREFVGSVALEKHINRSHKKHFHLYKYKCTKCEKYFKHPKELFAHYFSTHRDLQPYSCKICDKTFRIRKGFTLHIKMEHKSQGFVEFDENYHVFFAAEKSSNPFQPTSFFLSDVNVVDKNVTETEVEQTDAEATQVPETTDVETDIEKMKSENRIPPKMRFKKPRTEISLQSDFLNSEVENQTENEVNTKPDKTNLLKKRVVTRKRKRKLTQKMAIKKHRNDEGDFSEDEPLSKLRHRPKRNNLYNRNFSVHKSKPLGRNKKRFTCEICNEYCYTFQNYNHHVSTHSNREEKQCIKCSKRFKTNDELTKHMKKKHSTSKLTETLKNLLERRKLGNNNPLPQLTTQEKFKRTIKMVNSEPITEAAKLTEVTDNLSVQKFIESFTPDENTKKPEVLTSITIKTVDNPVYRQPAIKMKKFTPPQENKSNIAKLSMPVRYKQTNTDQQKVRVRLIQKPFSTVTESEDFTIQDYETHNNFIGYEAEIDSQDKTVPDVAQEVMLEEEKPRIIPHKLVIPKLKSTELKEIRIAHLLPEAPYFKIVKMKEVLAQKSKQNPELPETNEEIPKLPDGTKLVNVNPLAHLIRNKSIESLVGPATKYNSKSKETFERAIAQALLKLESPLPMRTPKRRRKDLSSSVET